MNRWELLDADGRARAAFCELKTMVGPGETRRLIKALIRGLSPRATVAAAPVGVDKGSAREDGSVAPPVDAATRAAAPVDGATVASGTELVA